MTSLESGLVIFCVIFSGALLGMLVAWRLPRHHVSQETQTMVTVSMAVVGTMSALVLGLLISSANNSFSTRNTELGRMSADIIRLDQLLHRYGPEADAAWTSLQKYTQMKFDDLFPEGKDKKPISIGDLSIGAKVGVVFSASGFFRDPSFDWHSATLTAKLVHLHPGKDEQASP